MRKSINIPVKLLFLMFVLMLSVSCNKTDNTVANSFEANAKSENTPSVSNETIEGGSIAESSNADNFESTEQSPSFKSGLEKNTNENGKIGFLDKDGAVIVPYIYDSAESFSSEYAVVSIDGNFGIINTRSEVVLPLEYQYIFNTTREIIVLFEVYRPFVETC